LAAGPQSWLYSLAVDSSRDQCPLFLPTQQVWVASGTRVRREKHESMKALGQLLVGLGKLLASGKWLIFIASLGALVAGCWLLYDVWQGQPVAAAFTRVGGETHVETALDASLFWTTAPRRVVIVSTNANEQTMQGAAQCAMAYDAPLLFRSADPKLQRMVDATIANSSSRSSSTAWPAAPPHPEGRPDRHPRSPGYDLQEDPRARHRRPGRC